MLEKDGYHKYGIFSMVEMTNLYFQGGDHKFIFPKVEITTTKNVERKIHRQLVLEDGRVVEEEVFIFALFNDNYDMSIVV